MSCRLNWKGWFAVWFCALRHKKVPQSWQECVHHQIVNIFQERVITPFQWSSSTCKLYHSPCTKVRIEVAPTSSGENSIKMCEMFTTKTYLSDSSSKAVKFVSLNHQKSWQLQPQDLFRTRCFFHKSMVPNWTSWTPNHLFSGEGIVWNSNMSVSLKDSPGMLVS